MKESYSNYGLDDAFIRTFMMPAVMPNEYSNMNMIPKTNIEAYKNNDNNLSYNSKFLNPDEGFLKGNLERGTYQPYKNMTYIKPNITNEREAMLYKLQQMAFAAHDINLYLDTHPNDTSIINLYNRYNTESKRLTNEYERKYGPIDLSNDEELGITTWSWINEPWPWNK